METVNYGHNMFIDTFPWFIAGWCSSISRMKRCGGRRSARRIWFQCNKTFYKCNLL